MKAHSSISGAPPPCSGAAESQRFDHDATSVRLESPGSAHGLCTSSNRSVDVTQLANVTAAPAGGAVLHIGKSAEVNVSSATVIGTEKRKRGRPPRGQAAAKPPPPKRKREVDEEEDVCFICFDGGSLVLCDRKGCPKAYHPACIKRDESFFRSKAKWNCGWHICSVCQKSSHYMCYTCTYSLCKGCFRNADYFCVRGNKGFCSTCMKTIMLVENKDGENKEMVKVDFDDKTSWEYLFKVYWILLKEKLSLTPNELIQAKNPWKEAVATQHKLQLANVHLYANDSKGVIGKSYEHLELKNHEETEELSKRDSIVLEDSNTHKTDNVQFYENDNKDVIGKYSEHGELKNHKELDELSKKDSLIPQNSNIAKPDNAYLYANDSKCVISMSSEHVEPKNHKKWEELAKDSLIPEDPNIANSNNVHLNANDSKGSIRNSSEHVQLKNNKGREELAEKDSSILENPNIAILDNVHLISNDGKCVSVKSSEPVEFKNLNGMEELAKKVSFIPENLKITNLDTACIDISDEHLGLTNPDEPQRKNMSRLANCSVMKGYTEWATKELLEFVAHMKNGDTSALSQFDVQEILLDYIKRNNLRDPHKKSEIICDLRLKNLFGKSRLGHIEMLKLIEFHFLAKENTQNNAFIPAGIVGDGSNHLKTDESKINLPSGNKNKRRKACKKGEEKAPQNSLDDYAAIDAHNINLIYLRRSLMENIIEDVEKFHDGVVGSFVRIKISSNDQKQDMYRLVHVVGTCKATPYKIGDKTADIMLEVLNLDKKEAVSIDILSNQEFSEDECRRLRQSIKCGLVKRMTVGEIQKKALALRPVKLNESLESEILRLSHLRDRASENGRKKDLRECIEKLQRLKTPEECHRRMLEIPEVHADPKMNPNYESEEDAGPSDEKKKDENLRQRSTRLYGENESKQTPPMKKAKVGGTVIALIAQHRPNEKIDTSEVPILGKRRNQTSTSSSVASALQVDQAVARCGPETSIPSLLIANPMPPMDSDEIEKLWHYRDPSGTIQGPFSMMQLRRWNKTGLFPPDMRVWTSDERKESILLCDALHWQSHTPQIPDKSTVGWPGRSNATFLKQSEGNHYNSHGDKAVHSNAELSSPRPSLQCLNLLNGNNQCFDKPQECSSSLPLSSYSEGKQMQVGPAQEERCSDTVSHHPTDTINHEIQSSGQSFMDQLFGENWGSLDSLPITESESMAGSAATHFVSVTTTKSGDSPPELNGQTTNDPSELPSPTPKKSNYESSEVKAAKELLSLSSDFPFHHQHSSPPPNESSGHSPSNIPVQDPVGPATACSLVIDGWDPGLVSVPSSLKPPLEVTHPSSPPLPPPSNVIEFSTLAEESVSDLLAEVDAMESSQQAQSGLGGSSPTSAMRCSVELMLWSKSDDCFSSIEEMNSSTTDPTAKNDAYSSTGDIARAAFDPPSRRCNGHSSTSSEGETKPTDLSFDLVGHSSEIHHPPVVPSWAVTQGGNTSYEYGNPGPGTGARQGWRNNLNMNRGGFEVGNVALDNSQRRQYSAERFLPPGPRDHWACQGGYPGGGGGGRSGRHNAYNRQSVTGGGGYSRPPKAQRVCKFYESGRCKKGASCDYLHP
ncbi:unnamed protein product [Cuscuta epithymum]|uniref:Zinc finger CCCH domain-containing protein 44 n=1 Tax=Cuscuta epithymum TaxID=186058 RepID=A0AAV0CZ78_9ASTE|nr:unnamed protein product [Cuscuta epithymum]